jgi:large subunit ribosomal protein L25
MENDTMATMKANRRNVFGSSKSRQLRRKGDIPGIVYGHGEEPVPVTLHVHEVELALQHGERLLEIELEGAMVNVLIKEVQYDTFGQEVLHVDLARVDLDELVEITVAVVLVGTPEGLKDGGVLQQAVGEVTIRVAVRSIPEELKVLVGSMKLNDRLFLKDIPLPESAELLEDANAILCTVAELAEEVAPAEGETLAEPEVIGAKKEEEGEEAAE